MADIKEPSLTFIKVKIITVLLDEAKLVTSHAWVN